MNRASLPMSQTVQVVSKHAENNKFRRSIRCAYNGGLAESLREYPAESCPLVPLELPLQASNPSSCQFIWTPRWRLF
jgi:hypothetical protein